MLLFPSTLMVIWVTFSENTPDRKVQPPQRLGVYTMFHHAVCGNTVPACEAACILTNSTLPSGLLDPHRVNLPSPNSDCGLEASPPN